MCTRFTWGDRLICMVATAVLGAGMLAAQQSSVDEGKRKIKSRTYPVYSELARRMNIAGKVKIEVVIAPDGHVRNARAIGGHPVLVQSCLDSVKEWRYEPGPEESTQIIEFEFKP